MTSWTIKTAEATVFSIDENYDAAVECMTFLNDVADIDGSDHYVITETTDADHVELALQEV